MKLYLDVNYAEKDEAKVLGAKYDWGVRKWYASVSPKEYYKFAKWLSNGSKSTIATRSIYIIEGARECWKCHKNTRIIGLGIGWNVSIVEKEDGTTSQRIHMGNDIDLYWSQSEENIPPRLLKYIKENYAVKTGYSQKRRARVFANHCDHCGAMQGNFEIFDEPDGPLSPDSVLKIIEIPIKDALDLNWEESFSFYDNECLEQMNFYCLNLSNDPKGATYEELYLPSSFHEEAFDRGTPRPKNSISRSSTTKVAEDASKSESKRTEDLELARNTKVLNPKSIKYNGKSLNYLKKQPCGIVQARVFSDEALKELILQFKYNKHKNYNIQYLKRSNVYVFSCLDITTDRACVEATKKGFKKDIQILENIII